MHTTSHPRRIPRHVPPELIFDFDIFDDPRLQPDPIAGYAAVREAAPAIFFTPLNGGHWVVTGYEDVLHVLKTPQVFSNRELDIPKTATPNVLLPLTLDPPEHAPYRQLLMQFFSAKAMHALEPHIRDWANRLIDAVIEDGGCDFVRAVSGVLPVSVFMQMMGLPLDRLAEFRGWVDEAFRASDTEVRAAVYRRIMVFMGRVIEARRAEPQDDLVSRMLAAEIDGRRLSLEEMQALSLLLFIAGMDTVANAMTFGMRRLAEDLALQDRLAADPALVPGFVEEVLRRYAFTSTSRLVATDEDYGAARFRAGDMVFCSFAAAGLDPAFAADPLAFDPERANASDHLTFGGGPHKCAGRHLGRIEMRILFEEVVRKMGDIRLDPAGQSRLRAGHVIAADRLDILFERR